MFTCVNTCECFLEHTPDVDPSVLWHRVCEFYAHFGFKLPGNKVDITLVGRRTPLRNLQGQATSGIGQIHDSANMFQHLRIELKDQGAMRLMGTLTHEMMHGYLVNRDVPGVLPRLLEDRAHQLSHWAMECICEVAALVQLEEFRTEHGEDGFPHCRRARCVDSNGCVCWNALCCELFDSVKKSWADVQRWERPIVLRMLRDLGFLPAYSEHLPFEGGRYQARVGTKQNRRSYPIDYY
jgi:hypothetical protein